jgi:hypothetical protein
VTRIDLVDVSRGLCREVALAPPDQISVADKLLEQRLHPARDMLRHRKRNSASAGRVVPFAPRPLVKVLEKVAMNRLKSRVGSVIGVWRKTFGGAICRQALLSCLK